EHLPHSLKRRTESNPHLDQLLAYLRAHTTVQVLDVRAAMHEAKARERLYDYTDSHWNGRGAYVAYDGLIEAMSPQFPGMRPVPRSDFDSAVGVARGGDCARLLGLRDHLAEEALGLVPRAPRLARWVNVDDPSPADYPLRPFAMERPGEELPRAVMFRDSFGA